MYKLAREDKFLFWDIFCIQLQVLSQWLKKQDVAHNLDEPDALLVYISVTEQQTLYDPAHEIFSKLGPTLLVVKFDKQHLELLESKIGEARSKKDTLKARAQSAKTTTKVS